jgi:hypothetical protein
VARFSDARLFFTDPRTLTTVRESYYYCYGATTDLEQGFLFERKTIGKQILKTFLLYMKYIRYQRCTQLNKKYKKEI